jgi:hypothetical protein
MIDSPSSHFSLAIQNGFGFQKRIDCPPEHTETAMTDLQSNLIRTDEALAFLYEKIAGARTDGSIRQQDPEVIRAVFTAKLTYGDEAASEMMARATAINPGDFAYRMNTQKQKRQKQATINRLRKRLAEKQ